MQSGLLFLLSFFARIIIQIHKPYVIGVTGTVGKTTISGHIASYLIHELGHHRVMHSPYHYNGEFWLPLTIIGVKTWGKNPFLWFWVFLVALMRLVRKYPQYLVLEYGIDHPKEMDFLLSIVVPDIAIVTEIMPNHIEQFGTLDRYRFEKLKICNNAKTLILHDSLRPYTDREAIYYWRGAMADIDASHISVNSDGTQAIIHAYDKDYPVTLPVFWEFQIDNLLPLYALAKIIGVSLTEIATYARTFTPESGRSGILKGIHHSIIIDGSYNGGFLSIHSGISSMRSFLHSHRLVFLIGDMRELGTETESLHQELAEEIINLFPHEADVVFVFVGPLSAQYLFPIVSETFPTFHFLSSRQAWLKVRDILREGEGKPTMIYAKGSQNTIFLEEAIKIILSPDEDIHKLCRQSSDWMKKKEIFFRSLTPKK